MQIFSIIPQRLDIAAPNVVFAGLTITGNSVFGLNSSVFQPTTDSTTFFQVLDADGGTPVLNIDTDDEQVHISGSGSTPSIVLKVSKTTNGAGFVMFSGEMPSASDEGAGILCVANDGALLGSGHRMGFVLFGGSTGVNSIDNSAGLTAFADGAWVSGNHPSRFEFEITPAGSSTRVTAMVIKNNSRIGFGDETDPETLTEWTHAQPYLTLHNSTHEDTDGGRESRLNFKGEQSGGEETTLARIEVSHDGAADDQLGRIIANVNTGAGVAEAMRLGSDLSSTFTKVKITPLGGIAIKLTNNTGVNTIAGQIVKADPDADDAFVLTGADCDDCFGVILDGGIADEAEAWIVVAGIADVAMEDNTAATRDNWVQTSETEAGYADATDASPQAAPQHFNEIGHCIETVAAGGGGTHILARCVIHFL